MVKTTIEYKNRHLIKVTLLLIAIISIQKQALLLFLQREETLVLIHTGDSLDTRIRILNRNRRIGSIVTHATTIKSDSQQLITPHKQKIIGKAIGRKRPVGPRKSLDIADGRVPLTLDDNRMNTLGTTLHIGNYRALRNLPISIKRRSALFVDAHTHAVEVEIRQLSVAVSAEKNATVSTEGKYIYHLGIVRVVDGVRKCGLCNNRVDHAARE